MTGWKWCRVDIIIVGEQAVCENSVHGELKTICFSDSLQAFN